VVVRFDGVMAVPGRAVWSHACSWVELALSVAGGGQAVRHLVVGPEWTTRWTATCRFAEGDVVVPVQELASVPTAGRGPVRRFSWHRAQRHRSGLAFLVSTGRHHGFESLQEARLLLMLDFAGGVSDVLSQPLRLRFVADDGPREHIPDFLACTTSGWWLIDVRPVGRIGPRDEVAFAAAAEVAFAGGLGLHRGDRLDAARYVHSGHVVGSASTVD
jgi:hypothetical protein